MIFLTSTGFTNPNVYKLLEKYSLKSIESACVIAIGMLPLKEKHPMAVNTYRFLVDKGIRSVSFYDPESSDSNILLNCDLVIILGGNACYLFNSIKKTGTDILLKKIADRGTHIIGASAGAMLLSSGNKYTKYFGQILGIEENMSEMADTQGLKFTNDILFPHYDMFLTQVHNLDNKLTRIENEFNIKITRLKNMDFIYIDTKGDRIHVKT